MDDIICLPPDGKDFMKFNIGWYQKLLNGMRNEKQ